MWQYYFSFMFWFFDYDACGIFAPRFGIQPHTLYTGWWSLDHRTTREIPALLSWQQNSCCENLHKKLVESAWYNTGIYINAWYNVLTLGSKLFFHVTWKMTILGTLGKKVGALVTPIFAVTPRRLIFREALPHWGTHTPKSTSKNVPPKQEHHPTSCLAFSLYLIPHWGWDLPEGGVWSHCLFFSPVPDAAESFHGVEVQTPGKRRRVPWWGTGVSMAEFSSHHGCVLAVPNRASGLLLWASFCPHNAS